MIKPLHLYRKARNMRERSNNSYKKGRNSRKISNTHLNHNYKLSIRGRRQQQLMRQNKHSLERETLLKYSKTSIRLKKETKMSGLRMLNLKETRRNWHFSQRSPPGCRRRVNTQRYSRGSSRREWRRRDPRRLRRRNSVVHRRELGKEVLN